LYHDCKCLFEELSSPIPSCSLITLDELQQARLTEDGLENLCKKNFISAFDNVPLSDNVYGLLGCTPSEMLHVSGTGLLKCMFECLVELISLTPSSKRDRETFDDFDVQSPISTILSTCNTLLELVGHLSDWFLLLLMRIYPIGRKYNCISLPFQYQ
jgi:hypothetical protein